MGMTIEQMKTKLDKSNIDSDTLIELTRYLEGYQKIKEIISNGDDTHYKLLMQIKEVVEDGNVDN